MSDPAAATGAEMVAYIDAEIAAIKAEILAALTCPRDGLLAVDHPDGSGCAWCMWCGMDPAVEGPARPFEPTGLQGLQGLLQ